MGWKDRSQEHEAVMWICATIAAIAAAYLIVTLATMASPSRGESVNTDTGNIRYHAKRIQEGL